MAKVRIGGAVGALSAFDLISIRDRLSLGEHRFRGLKV